VQQLIDYLFCQKRYEQALEVSVISLKLGINLESAVVSEIVMASREECNENIADLLGELESLIDKLQLNFQHNVMDYLSG